MSFRLGRWRYISIWDLRNITCFSQSLVYAATHWVLAANYSRAAIIIHGILLGALRMLQRIYLELSVLDGGTRILIRGATPGAEMIVRQMHSDPAR